MSEYDLLQILSLVLLVIMISLLIKGISDISNRDRDE